MAIFAGTIRKLSNADGCVVLNLSNGQMLRMNPMAARVLELLEQGESAATISEKLSAEFQVALAEVQSDIAQFIEALRANGVVVAA